MKHYIDHSWKGTEFQWSFWIVKPVIWKSPLYTTSIHLSLAALSPSTWSTSLSTSFWVASWLFSLILIIVPSSLLFPRSNKRCWPFWILWILVIEPCRFTTFANPRHYFHQMDCQGWIVSDGYMMADKNCFHLLPLLPLSRMDSSVWWFFHHRSLPSSLIELFTNLPSTCWSQPVDSPGPADAFAHIKGHFCCISLWCLLTAD